MHIDRVTVWLIASSYLGNDWTADAMSIRFDKYLEMAEISSKAVKLPNRLCCFLFLLLFCCYCSDSRLYSI